MTPYDAYSDISDRSRFMLSVYDGLLNVRRRGLRADWKRQFCRIMHWRRDIPIDRLDTRDALIILREGSGLTRNDFTHERLDDFLRSSLAMGVSALDRYTHERVVRRIIAAYKNTEELSREQENLSIPAPVVIGLGQKMLDARRQNRGQQFRPANIIRNEIQKFLHTRPFQSWREIAYAFSLIGVRRFDQQVQGAFAVGDINPIKDQLNEIVKKRNQIVHEGDLIKHQRAGNAHIRKNDITRRFVGDSLDFLDMFVQHLEGIN